MAMLKIKKLLKIIGIIALFAVLVIAIAFFMFKLQALPFEKTGTAYFKDLRDGKKYKTVRIGEQVWMAENMNYDVKGSKCNENKPENCAKYGRLYNWNAAKLACPAGWHLPSYDEWDALYKYADNNFGEDYYSETAGLYLKAASGWNESSNGEDKFGFAALPGGCSNFDGSFCHVGCVGEWWTATTHVIDVAYAYERNMKCGDYARYAFRGISEKASLLSVRCLQGASSDAKAAAAADEKAAAKAVARAAAKPVIAKTEELVFPIGYKAIHTAVGDLNLDKYNDMIMVLKKIDGEACEDDNEFFCNEKRPLLIYLGQADGKYKLVARNDNIVLCPECGGALGDPFQKVVIKNGYFSVEHQGGSREMWTRIITFKYSAKDKNWFLHKDGGDFIDGLEPDKKNTEVKTTKDFGIIPFGKFAK